MWYKILGNAKSNLSHQNTIIYLSVKNRTFLRMLLTFGIVYKTPSETLQIRSKPVKILAEHGKWLEVRKYRVLKAIIKKMLREKYYGKESS